MGSSGSNSLPHHSTTPPLHYSALPIVLASASPRRRELIRLLGLNPVIDPSDVEEVLPAEHRQPARVAVRLARAKAAQVATRHPGAIVIGADTVVALERRIFGKPADTAEACEMLQALSGRAHRVVTGLALLDTRPPGRQLLAAERTRVLFRALAPEEIAAYAATGEPMDKAGAYAIQGYGAPLIQAIQGDYPNVVGLPLTRLALMLREVGVRVLGMP
jgi:nucleoside triphosphate pyrophosphatase